MIDVMTVGDVGEGPRRLLGHPHEYVRGEVSASAGVSKLAARRFWHALGFPRVGDDDVVFTEADVRALDRVAGLVREGRLDETTALAMTRAMARSADSLAEWQGQLVAEMIDARRSGVSGGDSDTAVAAAALLVDLADELEPLVVYAWRRHLAAAVAQLASHGELEEAGDEHVSTIGFADMVGFTRLTRAMSERDLALLVQHFEATASDVVASYGGRLVKTIGDEVLFSADHAVAAAGIGLALIATLGEDAAMPPLRVGLARGPVISRLGDVYGHTVNLAARLTGLARPGTVIANEALAAALGGAQDVVLRQMRPRDLHGLGPTRAWVIRPARPGTLPPQPGGD